MSILIELLPCFGRALVVGGGAIAERKIRGLVEGGFSVTVVAPQVAGGIPGLPGVTVHARPFSEADIAGHVLVFACTDDRAVNRQVGEAARASGALIGVADRREESTFFTPAVHRDGDLAVAVSTGGSSPVLARNIRDLVATALGRGWSERVAAAGAERTERYRTGRGGSD